MNTRTQITVEDKIAAEDFARVLQQFPNSEKERWYFIMEGAKLAYNSMEQPSTHNQRTVGVVCRK